MWARRAPGWLALWCGACGAAASPPEAPPPAPSATVSFVGASSIAPPPPSSHPPVDAALESPLPPLAPEAPAVDGRARAWPPVSYAVRELAFGGEPVLRGDRLLLVDASDSRLLALPAGDIVASVGPLEAGHVAHGLHVTTSNGALAAFDLSLGRRRYRRDLGLGRGRVIDVALSNSAIVACVEVDVENGDRRRKLVALDASRGDVLWAVDLSCVRVAAAGKRAVVETAAGIAGIETANAKVVWGVDVGGDLDGGRMVASHEHAVVARTHAGKLTIHVLRVSDGSVTSQHTVAAASRVDALALEGGLSAAVVASSVGGTSTRARVVTLDVVAGRFGWSSMSAERPGAGDSARVAIDDDAVLHCVGDGVLRVSHRANGRVASELGLGSCDAVAFDRPTAASPIRVAARSRAFSERGEDVKTVIVERAAPTPPLERAVITGVTAPRARVRVHDVIAVAGTDGRYTARVSARGVVLVDAFATRDGFPIQSVAVRLDGRTGPYDVPMPFAGHTR